MILFGGTFDPIHKGHVGVAQRARDIIKADKVIFIPVKRSALKFDSPSATETQRMEMVTLAVDEIDSFDVSDCELKRPAPSYTIDTVRYFKSEFGPDVVLHWLIGADSIAELEHWHKIHELIDECCLTCMYRAGYEPPSFSHLVDTLGRRRVKKLQDNVIETPLIDISSTEIRKLLSRGKDASDILPPKVADYIDKHGLYR